jgi:hypothetical protein
LRLQDRAGIERGERLRPLASMTRWRLRV